MCGIAGIVGASASAGSLSEIAPVDESVQQLFHRGPDGKGIVSRPDDFLIFGHSRLSILDLSDAASQPMKNSAGNIITFNGEIYNYLELKEQLNDSGSSLSSTGDTEVLLQACSELGIEKTLEVSRGMFAFAFYSKQDRCVYLARDRFGEKPLYYAIFDGSLAFASEIKALLPLGVPGDLDLASVATFLRFQYSSPGHTSFLSIKQLLPGHFLKVPLSSFIDITHVVDSSYWSPKDRITSRKLSISHSLEESTEKFLQIFSASVKSQLISDVPVGAFLSGGIDSSLVVAIMKRESSSEVHSFSIGFEESQFDESSHAKEIAEFLGTRHIEFKVTAKDALELIPQLPFAYDDPFGDSSQIPTMLLSKLTREYVTVALSGDGADELFGGYNRYFLGNQLWKRIDSLPRPVTRTATFLLQHLRPRTLDRLGQLVTLNGRFGFSGSLSTRAERLSTVLNTESFEDFYLNLISHWTDPLIGDFPSQSLNLDAPPNLSELERMMYWDTVTYLPNDILTKVDRAAMAYSLETRAPFLTPEMFDFAWSLPLQHKVVNGNGKIVLKEALRTLIPEHLWKRPKQGFGVPIGQWLRNDLRDWAETLIYDNTNAEFLNNGVIETTWQQHLSRERNAEHLIWDILMLKLWLQQWRS